MIFIVLLGATMMNTALAVSQVPADLARWMTGLEVHPLLIIGGFLIAFVLLTCVLDELAMMLLFLPILLPIIAGLDLFGLTQEYKFIWFGILMLHVIAMGLVAPPIGLNVYVVSNIARTVPIGEIYRGVLPFLMWDVVRIALLLFIPAITLWAVQFVR
jgi:C4-dicarboxylate transporter DctM subunit